MDFGSLGRREGAALSGVSGKCGNAGAPIKAPVCQKMREGFSPSGGRRVFLYLYRRFVPCGP